MLGCARSLLELSAQLASLHRERGRGVGPSAAAERLRMKVNEPLGVDLSAFSKMAYGGKMT